MSREKNILQVLSKLEYGIYVVTMGKGEDGNAMTASWLTQVASAPPTIVVSIKNSHQSTRFLNESDSFAVNLLPEDQDGVARAYYGPAESGYKKLKGAPVTPSPVTGAPLIPGAVGYLDCKIVKRVPIGNHTTFFGEVVAAELEKEAAIMTSTSAGLRYAG